MAKKKKFKTGCGALLATYKHDAKVALMRNTDAAWDAAVHSRRVYLALGCSKAKLERAAKRMSKPRR